MRAFLIGILGAIAVSSLWPGSPVILVVMGLNITLASFVGAGLGLILSK